jgi:hypothetical protein
MSGADTVEDAERWAANYGAMGVFVARLLPVVRHLIGISAGIVRENFFVYSPYTLTDSALWSADQTSCCSHSITCSCTVICGASANLGQQTPQAVKSR